MARTLDQIVVIDVESTCWEAAPPPGQESEIIEIGICTLDVASGERLERQTMLVKPQISTVSDFCTRLTTLTQHQVDAGVTFQEACEVLKSAYSSRDRAWASYGDYDRRQFERQCQSRHVGYPFGPSHLNVKTLFALAHALRREVGMDEALQLLHLSLEGVHHRAGDDAWNIGLILSELILQRRAVAQGGAT